MGRLSVRFLILGLSILALDQYTKLLAERHLSSGNPFNVIPGFFNLTLVYNKGAAFGLFAAWPDSYRRIALITVSVVAMIVVFRFVLREARGDRWAQVALTGIIAGAIGNMLDRVRCDAVVDFLDFYWKQYHWPAFNVADSAICIGVTILIWRMALQKPTPSSSV